MIRDLRTSQGKVLTKDAEYTLLERRKEKKVGKNKTVDYAFELDLANPDADQEESKEPLDPEKLRAPFYMNLDDFSIFKLRSIIFLINFPFAYSIAIITCWYKSIPESP